MQLLVPEVHQSKEMPAANGTRIHQSKEMHAAIGARRASIKGDACSYWCQKCINQRRCLQLLVPEVINLQFTSGFIYCTIPQFVPI